MHVRSSGFLTRYGLVIPLLLANWILVTFANLCFKEGGTEAGHRLLYLIIGSILGISGSAVLMGIYSRMNVNLALVISGSGSFILTQFVFWKVYDTPLTPLQWAGISIVFIGTGMAAFRSSVESKGGAIGSGPGTDSGEKKDGVPC